MFRSFRPSSGHLYSEIYKDCLHVAQINFNSYEIPFTPFSNSIDIFVNANCVETRWQQYSTHLHTDSTQNNTSSLGRVRAVPRLCELYRGICLTHEEKAWKNISQGSRRVPVGTMKTEYTEKKVHNNKNI